jgi:uncharacterized protein
MRLKDERNQNYLPGGAMKSKLLLTIISLVTIFALAACSTPVGAPAAATTPKEMSGTLTAQGIGKVILTPDVAYISIGVESRSDQVAVALSLNNNQAASIAGVLQGMGVEERDIQTSAFSVYPMQEYNPMGEMTGTVYVVSNTVNITVRNLNSMGELLDAVVQAGANNIHSIQFDVENKDLAVKEARRLAITEARQTAQELAEAAGVELGDLVNMNVYTAGSPIPVYEGKIYSGVGTGGSDVPVAAGQMILMVNADMTYQIK